MNMLVLLSAPADIARPIVRELIDRNAGAHLVFYVRTRDRRHLEDLLAGHDIRSDKPGVGGRDAMLADLRKEQFDMAHALAFGHRSYLPAKLLLWACRAESKRWHTRSGVLEHSLWRPDLLLSHALRCGLLLDAARVAYRATVGRLLGGTWTLARHAWRVTFR